MEANTWCSIWPRGAHSSGWRACLYRMHTMYQSLADANREGVLRKKQFNTRRIRRILFTSLKQNQVQLLKQSKIKEKIGVANITENSSRVIPTTCCSLMGVCFLSIIYFISYIYPLRDIDAYPDMVLYCYRYMTRGERTLFLDGNH